MVKIWKNARGLHENTKNWGSGGSGGDQKIMPKMNSKILQKMIGSGTLFIAIWASFRIRKTFKKSIKNSTHFGTGFGIDFGFILAHKIHSKMHLKTIQFFKDFFNDFGRLLSLILKAEAAKVRPGRASQKKAWKKQGAWLSGTTEYEAWQGGGG